MKIWIYIALILTVIPLQTTLLHHVTILDVRPDLGLVVVCLVGFFGGEVDGLLIGSFSAGLKISCRPVNCG